MRTLRQQVSFYLEDIETRRGQILNLTIVALVLLSSGIFIAQTYPIPPSLHHGLELLDRVILTLFAVEYLLRLWAAEQRLQYVLNIYSMIDLLAIFPFFLGWADVSFLRVLRWFRILRLIRFFGGKTIFGYRANEDNIIFTRILLTLFVIVFIFSGLIFQVEHSVNSQDFSTFLDAVYFSIATMTTVGFGDVTPKSQLGRLLAVTMILTGVILIPWQVGDLVKRLVNRDPLADGDAPAQNFTRNSTNLSDLSDLSDISMTRAIACSNCGLAQHDGDAQFCKQCGTALETITAIAPTANG